jgi:arylsulfatase
MNIVPGAGKGKPKAKTVASGPPKLTIQLYNLKTDPSETTDVATKNPDVVAKIEKIMRDQHTPNPEFPLPGIDS